MEGLGLVLGGLRNARVLSMVIYTRVFLKYVSIFEIVYMSTIRFVNCNNIILQVFTVESQMKIFILKIF